MGPRVQVSGVVQLNHRNMDLDESESQIVAKVKDALGELLPSGSEGSVQYRIHVTGKQDSTLRVVVVVFWGDLEDRDDDYLPTVVEWFKEFLKRWAGKKNNVGCKSSIMEISATNVGGVYTSYETDGGEIVVEDIDSANS